VTIIFRAKQLHRCARASGVIPENYRFYINIRSVDLWIKDLYILGSGQDNHPLKWMKSILNVNMWHRPIAQLLFRVASSHKSTLTVRYFLQSWNFCDSYIQVFYSSRKPAYNFLSCGNNKGKAVLSPRGLKSHVRLGPQIGDWNLTAPPLAV
jgi:hypothetical protein